MWNPFHKYVEEVFNQSFNNLNLEYIDLFLMHTPMGTERTYKTNGNDSISNVELSPTTAEGLILVDDSDYLDTWKAMEELIKTGRVRSIGVSNFNSEQIDRIIANSNTVPVTNQVECHPNFNQRKLIEFCAERNVTVTAYSPFGRPHLIEKNETSPLALNDPKVKAIADRLKKTPGQVILRYLVYFSFF